MKLSSYVYIVTVWIQLIRSHEGRPQDIIFPDDNEEVFESIPPIGRVPKCPDGQTFCEDFDAYPYQHLKNILRKHNVTRDFPFGEDDMLPELETRIEAEGDHFMCGVVHKIVFPKIGKNKDDEWKYIVNQGKNDGYIQGVRIELCRKEGEACDLIKELPQGFTASCKQKFIHRKLLSVNEKGVPVADIFPLPSACCCYYKRDMDFLARFGKIGTPIK